MSKRRVLMNEKKEGFSECDRFSLLSITLIFTFSDIHGLDSTTEGKLNVQLYRLDDKKLLYQKQ